jgi:2-polyprenyl-3-methyl-5-hydroxy-6-metoxy-1,4-benzoquinol methylase
MPEQDQKRERARELAAEFLRKGEPYGWFEVLYREGQRGQSVIPWGDRGPNANLVAFWAARGWNSSGQTALVVGCGLGDDAEQIAAWGFPTTAFDVSETAIVMAKERFPHSPVAYGAVDLFHSPAEWRRKFDFVFESNTLQALPRTVRGDAVAKVAEFVAPRGALLVIARGREESEPEGQLPWPLTREELAAFLNAGLAEESFEDFPDPYPPHTRRFRAFYRRK